LWLLVGVEAGDQFQVQQTVLAAVLVALELVQD
jgi:hypothetical protein